jgi:hypothetical protein
VTRGQRRVLGAVGCLIVVVSLAWVAAAAGSDGEQRERGLARAGGDDAASTTTETTLPLIPVTSGQPLPPTSTTPPSVPLPTPEQVAAATPTTIASASAPAPAGAGLSGEGALLVRPATDSVRAVDKAKGCNSANDPGWRIVECGALKRDDVVLLWVVQSRGKGLRALVLREQTAGQWTTVLAANDDDGTRWSKIGVRGADVSGDGRPDLVFGFRTRAADNALAVDVVDGPGTVGLHLLLPGGSARAEVGALHGWAMLADGSYEHTTYKRLANAWRVAATERVGRDRVPPSMV